MENGVVAVKLPTYQQRALPDRPMVSPGQAAAPGMAAARFAQVATQVAGGLVDVAQDIYDRESVSEFNRANAELVTRAQQTERFLDQTPSMTKEQLGDLWRPEWEEDKKEMVVNPVTGLEEEQITKVNPTWRHRADYFAREVDNAYTEISDQLRTPKAKNSFAENYTYKLQPKWQGEKDAEQYDLQMDMERAQFAESTVVLVHGDDVEPLSDAIELAAAVGIIPAEKVSAVRRDLLSQWAVNDYARDLLDDELTVDEKEGLISQIENDPLLTEAAKIKLTKNALKAVYDGHVDRVEDAVIDRNVPALLSLRAGYTEKEYEGLIGDKERSLLVSRINSVLKSWQEAAGARQQQAHVNAEVDADRTLAALNKGEPVSQNAIAMLPEQIRTYIATLDGPPNKSEQKKIRDYESQLATVGPRQELLLMPVDDARNASVAYAGSVAGSSEGDHQGRLVLSTNENLERSKIEDPQTYLAMHDPGVELAGFDPGDIEGSAARNLEASNFAGQALGAGTQGFSQRYVDDYMREFNTASGVQQMAMRDAVTFAADGNPDVLKDFYDKAGLKGDHQWVLASAPDATAADFLAMDQGGAIDSATLKTAYDFYPPDYRAQAVEELAPYYPITNLERADAVVTLASGYVQQGLSSDAAYDKAKLLLAGGEPVRNAGSRTKVIPPPGIKGTGHFRSEQTRIGNDFYHRHGVYPGQDVQELVRNGDIIWRNSEHHVDSYYLIDTRFQTDTPITKFEDGLYKPIVIRFGDATEMDKPRPSTEFTQSYLDRSR